MRVTSRAVGAKATGLRRRARVSPLVTELRRGPAAKLFCVAVLWSCGVHALGAGHDELSASAVAPALSVFVLCAGWHGSRERRCRTAWLRHTSVRSPVHRVLLATLPAVFWPCAAALPLLRNDYGSGLTRPLAQDEAVDVLFTTASFANLAAPAALVAFVLGRWFPFRLVAPVLAVGGFLLVALLPVFVLSGETGPPPEPARPAPAPAVAVPVEPLPSPEEPTP
ncbi:hypothetical protein AB0B50_11215 [Streptomyces sp. NPDC041068]|uniref:hypothetical protein n=1 Tax=Streptomyces sp. NPDC041068 TaxID=3155130 RepID=UPI0033CFF076